MRLFFILCFILASASMAQYTYKKIIMTSCESEKSASDYLDKFSHKQKNKQLLAEKESYGFDFVVKQIGNYHIVSVEPLENQKTANRILLMIREIEPDAYVASAYWKTPIDFKTIGNSNQNGSRTVASEKKSPASNDEGTETIGNNSSSVSDSEEQEAFFADGVGELSGGMEKKPTQAEAWVEMESAPAEQDEATEGVEEDQP